MESNGINKLAQTLQARMKQLDSKPPVLDFGLIKDDMSLLTNKFPLPIPQKDYVICRSVCYAPEKPLSMTWWYDEGWKDTEWNSKDEQPQEWKEKRWGELIDPNSGLPYWDKKHKKPPITGSDHAHGAKGEHSHEEDDDGKHYHNIYLPKKMYRIQPGDRVLVAWVGDEAVVVDIIMAATEAM